MRIKSPSSPLVTLFRELLPSTGGAERTMFGCPSGFLGGNLFCGVFEDKLFVRLAEGDRAKLLAEEGAEPFDPMGGRPMREYVVFPSAWLEGNDDDVLRSWMMKAARYAKTLPPKSARRAAPKPTPKPSSSNPRPAKRLKSAVSDAPVKSFFATLEDDLQADCLKLDTWMRAAVGSPGAMDGKSIVGYGTSLIHHADGRDSPWMKIGFSPRKHAIVLYGVLAKAPKAALERLGKYTTGKGCLYIKRLADVHEGRLRDLLKKAAK
jgi:TfoX/Sxy family transcriptional regulator of competence genes